MSIANLEGSGSLPRTHGSWVKTAVESWVAALLLLTLAPLFLVIAVLIKIDSPGPVFFWQQRSGLGGTPFWILKFRTMAADRCDASGRQQTQEADPRVTRVGRVLRATSLDELPQLFNVLRTEMALIGPRAHPCAMRVEEQLCEVVLPDYRLRHRVRPGITGLAQVNGSRGAVATIEALRQRTDMDNWYIENWSAFLDLRILMRTLWVVGACTGR